MKHILWILAVLAAFGIGFAVRPKVIRTAIVGLFPIDHYWSTPGMFYRMNNDTLEHTRINTIEKDVMMAEDQLCQLGQSNSCRWVNGVSLPERENQSLQTPSGHWQVEADSPDSLRASPGHHNNSVTTIH